LARAQTAWVRARLQDATGRPAPEVLVTSEGDVSNAALTSFGGQGVFVTAVREAVVDGRADVAVHSMKDMPTLADPRTVIAAVPVREDTRDCVVTRHTSLADLPRGATVATGSPRRSAYLKRRRPDLRVVGIRGNVDSRVAAVDRGDVDAVVIAAAGLRRLGLQPDGFLLEEHEMLPAVGQGALSLETRAGDALVDAVATLDDAGARAEITAERALLAGLRAGCAAPVGARARQQAGQVRLTAAVLSPDGAQMYESVMSGSVEHAYDIGAEAARDLIGQGAGRLLGENR
jgi:hydroxymethylbilane synthase